MNIILLSLWQEGLLFGDYITGNRPKRLFAHVLIDPGEDFIAVFAQNIYLPVQALIFVRNGVNL